MKSLCKDDKLPVSEAIPTRINAVIQFFCKLCFVHDVARPCEHNHLSSRFTGGAVAKEQHGAKNRIVEECSTLFTYVATFATVQDG